jgi:hypothetical protein
MRATRPQNPARGTLEGALCLVRCVAQGIRASLPGVDALTPAAAGSRALAHSNRAGLEWFTVGGEFSLPGGHGGAPAAPDDTAIPNDLVVPSQGCHDPGIAVRDSLHLTRVHHHGYFSQPAVREQLRSWLL